MVVDVDVGSAAPFLIPVVVFALGVLGYAVLFVLDRIGVLERL